MASPLTLRTPTCLACLRRIAQPTRSAVLTQLRGKKTKSKLIVQLTDDVPGWGPKGNIVRISRESMRATWYPTGKMRYITPEEYRKAQYREEDIAIRNRSFGMNVPEEVPEEEEFYDPLAEDMARLEQSRPAVEVEQLEPARALELLNQFIPATLTFERRLVHPNAAPVKPTPEPAVEEATVKEPTVTAATPEPAKPTHLSGLAARRARILQQKAEEEAAATASSTSSSSSPPSPPAEAAPQKQQKEAAETHQLSAEEQRKIHGSVSTLNIAQLVREMMLLDPEAARIQVGPEDVTFVKSGDGEANKETSKVERIGTYEVKIRAHVGKTKVDSIWRTIEVVPNREEATTS